MLQKFLTENEKKKIYEYLDTECRLLAYKNLERLAMQGVLNENLICGVLYCIMRKYNEAIECFFEVGRGKDGCYFTCFIRNMRLAGSADCDIAEHILLDFINAENAAKMQRYLAFS